MLGVNLGRLAFLAEVNLDELPDALDRIDRDEHWIEERAVMTVAGTCFPMHVQRVQRLRALARPGQRAGGAGGRGRGRGLRALHRRRAGDRDADRLDRVLVRGRRADRLAAPPRPAGHAGRAARGVRPRRASCTRTRTCACTCSTARRRCCWRPTASAWPSCAPGDCIEFTISDAPGADPAPAAAGLLRARAAQAAAHGLLRARAAVNRRGRERRGRPVPTPVERRTDARAGRGRRRPAPPVVAARCCSTGARRGRSTSPTRAGWPSPTCGGSRT